MKEEHPKHWGQVSAVSALPLPANGPDEPAPGAARELIRQARFARDAGSPFVASILEAGYRHLHLAPLTSAMFADWLGDPADAALAMRFNAAIHRLARRGDLAELTRLYAGIHDDADKAVAEAMERCDAAIADAMRHPTQTNEVARSAALLAALMVLTHRHDMPFELLELGASCGLNLNFPHYAYDLGGLRWPGHSASRVWIAPDWYGPPPPDSEPRLVSATGVDLNPLDPTDPESAEALMSFIWARQPKRSARLAAALAVARQFPPHVIRAEAVSWLKDRLAQPQAAGTCRVVFHSMFRQYLSEERRAALRLIIETAGLRATTDRPLATISYEWCDARSEVRLLLTTWPNGRTEHLADVEPYGRWLAWLGPTS